MTVKLLAKFKAGGGTMPLYHGEKRFLMSTSPDDKPVELLDRGQEFLEGVAKAVDLSPENLNRLLQAV